MSESQENAYYFRALVDLLTEAELQLKAHGNDADASRYHDLLAELRNSLNTAIAASRFILAELGPHAETHWRSAVSEGLPKVH